MTLLDYSPIAPVVWQVVLLELMVVLVGVTAYQVLCM